MEKVIIFISYAHEDEENANKLKECFEKILGFEVFFAAITLRENFSTNDIDDIYSKLINSDICVPVISDAFNNSIFANQEIGVALGSKIRILPITFTRGKRGVGLIERAQMHEYSDASDYNCKEFVAEVFAYLIIDDKFTELRKTIIDNLISALSESEDWIITTSIIWLIKRIHESSIRFNDQQLANVISANKNNNNVSSPPYMHKVLKEIIQKEYGIDIDNE